MTKKESINKKDDEDIIIRNQMAKMVNTYDLYMKRITFGREDALRKMTVNLAQVKQGDSVLEVGCATGTLSLAAKRETGPSGRVSAIDIIPEMIEVSRKKAEQAGLEVSFLVGNIDNIPFPDESFDVVMCSFMIFHMSEKVRNKGIKEIFRVLRPGGRFLILDLALPPKPLSRIMLKFFLGFMLKHELEELRPVMESTGFSKTEISRAKYRVIGLPILSFVLSTK